MRQEFFDWIKAQPDDRKVDMEVSIWDTTIADFVPDILLQFALEYFERTEWCVQHSVESEHDYETVYYKEWDKDSKPIRAETLHIPGIKEFMVECEDRQFTDFGRVKKALTKHEHEDCVESS